MVSFDADWSEIYIGSSRRDTFTALCPNNVPEAAKVATTSTTATAINITDIPKVITFAQNVFQKLILRRT